ncbi:MAG: hypothetical protein JRJ38_20395 [Deltaproteobacteria bacterium]|nr:hypothetical protein [Deltaproteobacteria bacterium]
MPWVRRKILIISFFSLLALAGEDGIAAGQENDANLRAGGQVTHRKICCDDTIPLSRAISISGKEVSAKELARICGKGLGGVQATGAGQSGLSGKIILWDEVKARNIARIEFSNRGNSMTNAQKNSLNIWGK